jgi:menaquinone-specific isochorismate synthase
MLATTVAWDNSLSWTWEMAIDELQATMSQVRVFGLRDE